MPRSQLFRCKSTSDEGDQQVGRRVRFCDKDNNSTVSVKVLGPLLVPSSEMEHTDKLLLWWQPSDIQVFVSAARVLSEECRRFESPDSNSYSAVHRRIYESCQSGQHSKEGLNSDDISKLAQWNRVAHSRRGLERWSVRETGQRRAQCKHTAIKGVLQVQKKLRPRQSPEVKAECIRMVSESLSRSARLHAFVLGEADAMSQYESDPPSSNYNRHSLFLSLEKSKSRRRSFSSLASLKTNSISMEKGTARRTSLSNLASLKNDSKSGTSSPPLTLLKPSPLSRMLRRGR